jgi:site-specific recombinase XerD
MSTETKSRLIRQPTLADVLDRLQMVANLSERRRKDLASDVRSFCRIVELPVDRVAACTPVLRQLAERTTRAAKTISRGRWSNILSGLRKSLQLTGIRPTKFELLPQPAPVWEELLTLVYDKRRIVFSRFARYCTKLAITPEQVDDLIICQFRQALEDEAFSDPASKIARLCRAWNKAAEALSGWPQQRLTIPHRVRGYSLPWSVYPVSLQAEIEHYLAKSLTPDPLDPDAPSSVRPATIVTRKQTLRELAAGRVARGTPVAEIRGLADLVKPAALVDGLYFFVDRAGNTVTPSVLYKAILGRSIARNFLKLPEAELTELDRICKRISSELGKYAKRGLTEKNQRRLHQFLDDKQVAALVALPQALYARAKRRPVDLRSALTVQTAVAIELLTMTLLRSSNIRCLSYSKHFVRARFRGRRVMHLVLSAQQVKNSVDLEFPLLERTTIILKSYMDIYQPILSRGHETDLLFPGLRGQPKARRGFGHQVTDAIRRATGIEMHPHLFRHLGAFLFLNAHPGEYETVRRLLGHNSITTTIKFYVGLQAVADFRRYDDVILGHGPSGKKP